MKKACVLFMLYAAFFQYKLQAALTVQVTNNTAYCTNYTKGSLTLVASLGTAPYTYLWENGATTANRTQLRPGVYSYTVTDATLAKVSGTVEVRSCIKWTNVTGITITGTTLKKTAATGWGNAGANSINLLSADEEGNVAYTVNLADKNFAFGMDAVTSGNTVHYSSILYGFLINNNRASALRAGAVIADLGPIVNGNTLKLIKKNNIIYYQLNNVTVLQRPMITPNVDLRIEIALNVINQVVDRVNASFFRKGLALTHTKGDATLENPNAGYLAISGGYGLAPYTYKWNTGSTQRMISGLAVANYRGVVKDVTGDSVVLNRSIGYSAGLGIAKNSAFSSDGLRKINETGFANMSTSNYIKAATDGWFEFELKPGNVGFNAVFQEFTTGVMPDAPFTTCKTQTVTLTGTSVPNQTTTAYKNLNIVDASNYPTSIQVVQQRFVDAANTNANPPTLTDQHGLVLKNGQFFVLRNGLTNNKPIAINHTDLVRMARTGTSFMLNVNGINVFTGTIGTSKNMAFNLNLENTWLFYGNLVTGNTDVINRPSSCANNNKNWTYDAIYDGLGNLVSESRTFMDDMGRTTQTLSKDVAKNNVIAVQTVYDGLGRGVLNTLPAPTFQTELCYFNNFINNASNTNYGIADFDVKNYTSNFYALTPGERDNPKPVATAPKGSVGWYYSANNTDEPYVATTTIPYTRSEFSGTNPGSILKASIAGDGLKHGSGHEAYQFAMKTAGELYYFMGFLNNWKVVDMQSHFDNYTACRTMTDVKTEPNCDLQETTVKKISLDQNGDETVSFYDATNNLIGQCLSGSVNGSNQQIQALTDYVNITPGNLFKYIDIHLPNGCQSSLVLEQPPSGQGSIYYTIINLKTERADYYLYTGTNPVLTPGYYRITVENAPTNYSNLIKVKYNTNYYNFTANFYDKANRLRIVVPPKGINYGGTFITSSNVSNGTTSKAFGVYTGINNVVLSQPPNVEYMTDWYLINGSGSSSNEMNLTLPNNPGGGNVNVHNFVVAFTGQGLGYSLTFPGEGNPTTAYRTVSSDNVPATGNMAAARYPINRNDAPHQAGKRPDLGLKYAAPLSYDDPNYAMRPVNQNLPSGYSSFSACSTTLMPVKISYQLFDQNNVALTGATEITGYCTIQQCSTSYNRSWSFPTPNVHQIANACNAATGNVVKLRILSVWAVKTPNYTDIPFTYISDITGFLGATTGVKGNCPAHAMTEVYEYNSWGELLRRKTPDSGTLDYAYGLDGSSRFSQNSKQDVLQQALPGQSGDKFSYTNVDEYDRPIEGGEYWTALTTGSSQKVAFQNYTEYLANGVPSGATSVVDLAAANGNIQDALRTAEQTYMGYDVPDPNFQAQTGFYPPTPFTQEYLVGKLSYSYNSERVTWYSYDELGRLKWQVQKYLNIPEGASPYTLKTFYYNYDYLGNLTESYYQYHLADNVLSDKLKQEFVYDAAKRLIKVKSTIYATATPETKTDAEYFYYLHGPLKRKQLANNLQGVDYVYTVNGWLKNMNGPEMDLSHDPGADGDGTTFGKISSKDLFGMTLDYFNGDYQRSSTNIQTYAHSNLPLPDGYNGRIKAQRWQTKEPIANSGMAYQNKQLMYGYMYDRKSQLTEAKFGEITANHSYATIGGTGPLVSFNDDYRVYNLTYDANGNLLTLARNAYAAGIDGQAMDYMSYNYITCTNKLRSAADAIIRSLPQTPDPYANTGFKSGQAINNYGYNVMGELISDLNGVKYYTYNSVGNITAVKNASGNPIVEYFYDEGGQRYLKKSYNGGNVLNTFYVRDAGGSVVSVFDRTGTTGDYTAREWNIYGDGRLATAYLNAGKLDYVYELTDHLGSARTTFKQGVKQSFVTDLTAGATDNMYLLDPNNTIINVGGTLYSSVVSPSRIKGISSCNIPAMPGDAMVASVGGVVPSLVGTIPAGSGLVIDLVDENGVVLATAFNDLTVSGPSSQVLNTNLTNPSNAPLAPKRFFRVYVRNNTTVTSNFVNLSFNLTGAGGMPSPLQVDVSNYYPQGSNMPGLTYNSSIGGRYGYQGQFAENDKEINEQFFELRNYDPLLARFSSIDPYEQFWSPYLAMGNDHVNQVDENGGLATTWQGAIIGAVAGAVITGVVDYAGWGNNNEKKKFDLNWGWYVGAAATGFVGGGIAGGLYDSFIHKAGVANSGNPRAYHNYLGFDVAFRRHMGGVSIQKRGSYVLRDTWITKLDVRINGSATFAVNLLPDERIYNFSGLNPDTDWTWPNGLKTKIRWENGYPRFFGYTPSTPGWTGSIFYRVGYGTFLKVVVQSKGKKLKWRPWGRNKKI